MKLYGTFILGANMLFCILYGSKLAYTGERAKYSKQKVYNTQ